MKRALAALAILVVIGVAAAATFIWRVRADLEKPYRGYSEERRVVFVEEGESARAILADLEVEGVIENALWTRLYLSRVLEDPSLKAGEYAFDEPMAATAVLDKLIRGDVVTHPVTLVEGLDLFETAAHLASVGFGDEAEFLRLVESPELIADLDPEATNLEGYLFPDTYAFARGTSEAEIIATLVATFRQRLATVDLPGEAEPSGENGNGNERRPGLDLSLRELVTLASIVEKETSLDEERPMVAGVYANRLDRGIGLFADPTVIYGLKLQGTWDGNLRRRDLEGDSPYNTYRVAGLPPGPICSPGLASLQAAAAPADVPYFYFVSRNDGSHVFSRTLAEHNRNVEIWQKRYWREKWARERGER